MSERDLPLESIFHLCANKEKGKCPVRFCRRCSRKGGRLCGTHHVAAWRKRNPTKAAWRSLVDHAKGRKIKFDIPFEAFVELCEATGYIEGKGQRPEDLAIDRIDAAKGYTLDNIRVITVEANGRKGATEDRIRLKNGRLIEWDCISIDAHLREKEERRQSFNPYPKGDQTEQSVDCEDDDEIPAWLRADYSTDYSNIDAPF